MDKSRAYRYCAALFCALAFVNFALDALCLRLVGDAVKPLIKGVVSLRLVKNSGAAFSLLSARPHLASIISAALILLMLAFALFGKLSAPARLSLTAALCGGACNLYSRLVHGAVNDWIQLEFVEFPVFNFADVCVCAGAALFALFYLCGKGEQPKG